MSYADNRLISTKKGLRNKNNLADGGGLLKNSKNILINHVRMKKLNRHYFMYEHSIT